MYLADLKSSRGLSGDPPSSYYSLLRVALFNIDVALAQGHITTGATQDVFRELLETLEAEGWTVAPFHVDRVYEKLAAILARTDPALFFCRVGSLVSFLDDKPISFQPSWTFKFWLDDDIPEARLEEHSESDVATLLQIFSNGGSRRPEAEVGKPILWLTPNAGEVKESINAAVHDRYDAGHAAVESAGYGERLRDLLGLQSRVFPERAIAVVVDRNIGEFQADVEEEAIRENRAPRKELAAPTQFDAGVYPRFRHWPQASGGFDRDYGRTWDLGEDARGNRMRGAPEFISRPIPLDRVASLISLGPIITDAPSEEVGIELDRQFADELCGDATIATLLDSLSTVLAL